MFLCVDSAETIAQLAVPVGVRAKTEWTTLGTLYFLQACLRNKHLLRSRATKQQGQGRKSVVNFLYEKELYNTKKDLKERLSSLLATYESCESTWPYRPTMAEYLDETPTGSSNIKKCIEDAKAKAASNPLPKPSQQKRALSRGELAIANKKMSGVYTLDEAIAEGMCNQ